MPTKIFDEAGTPRAFEELFVSLPLKYVLLFFDGIVEWASYTQTSVAYKQDELEHFSGQLDWQSFVSNNLNNLLQQ
jgi:hypothetical protein